MPQFKQMKLIPYTVTIRKKGSSDLFKFNEIEVSSYDDSKKEPLADKEKSKKTDILDIIKEFLGSNETEIYDDINKTITVEKYKPDLIKREIYGIIKSGEYGIPADFLNVTTKKVENEARKPEHSEIFPFFFHFHLPSDKETGILLLQTFGNQGIKTVLYKCLNEYLQEKFYKDNLIIDINPFLTKDALEKIKKADKLVKLRLLRKDMPKNKIDRIKDAKFGKNKIGSHKDVIEERVFYAKPFRKLSKDGIVDIITNAVSNNETSHYEVFGEQYSEMKVLTEIEGSQNVVEFGPIDKVRESLLLNKKNEPFLGFPECEYILTKSKAYLNHLKDIMEK